MILTDKEAIKQFKRNATFHKYNLWLDDNQQKMMIKSPDGWFTHKMSVYSYSEMDSEPIIYREEHTVSKNQQFKNSVAGGIVGGGVGSVLGAMYGAEHPKEIKYYVNPCILLGFHDGFLCDIVVYNGRLNCNSLLRPLVDHELSDLLNVIKNRVLKE